MSAGPALVIAPLDIRDRVTSPLSVLTRFGENAHQQSGRAMQTALDQLSLLGLDNNNKPEPQKKSINMTECVPVPSSEHVAEIVGRQGCKIKALRSKTNTYIKTPVRGEEPVFVVTGRTEDVAMARREIKSAAGHFSMIRASRNKNTSLNESGATVPGPPNIPGQTTIQVRVPYCVVGLVVGPKGATIKGIQQQTHTYIVTPSRDKEPVFELMGMPENVDRACKEIEAHIAMRTRGLFGLQDDNDFHTNGTDSGLDLHGQASNGMTPTSMRKPFSNSLNDDSSSSLGSASPDSYFGNSSQLSDYSPPSPALSYTTTNNDGNNNNHNLNMNTNGNGFVYGSEVLSPDSTDLTIDTSLEFDPNPATPGHLWSYYENNMTPSSNGGTPPDSIASLLPAITAYNANGMIGSQRSADGRNSWPSLSPPLHSAGSTAFRKREWNDAGGGLLSFPGYSIPLASLLGSHLSESRSDSSSSSCSSSTSSGPSRKGSRDCSVCCESEVIAALVPCGHNLFCLECANRICERNNPKCPVCHTGVTQAIQIFS